MARYHESNSDGITDSLIKNVFANVPSYQELVERDKAAEQAEAEQAQEAQDGPRFAMAPDPDPDYTDGYIVVDRLTDEVIYGCYPADYRDPKAAAEMKRDILNALRLPDDMRDPVALVEASTPHDTRPFGY